MTDRRTDFYKRAVAGAIADTHASVLVVGGGEADSTVFSALGFSNVVLSNLDVEDASSGGAVYPSVRQDAEALTYPDASFDFVVANAVLHHCRSPHKALLEAYRVARRGVVAIEARDSALMRWLERAHVAQVYERTAVLAHDGGAGGVRNSDIPNFIFRWTEREVEKTIHSFAPHARHRFSYRYGYDAPAMSGGEGSGRMMRALISLAMPFYRAFALVFPRQQNLFAFVVWKPLPDDLQPWLRLQDGRPVFNADWPTGRGRSD